MLNKKPDTDHPKIWIELERTPSAEFNQRQAELANKMLKRLSEPGDPTNRGFNWSKHEGRYTYGGPMGYRVLTDDGEWFNLEYFGRD